MNRQLKHYLQASLIGMDLFILNLSYFLSRIFLYEIMNENIPESFYSSYFLFWLLINASWIIISFYFGIYNEKSILHFETFTKRSAQVYFLWIVIMLFYLFFSREFKLSRFFIISTITIFGTGLIINRFLYLSIKKYFRKQSNLLSKVMIIGYNDTARKLENYFEEEGLNMRLVGFVENSENVSELTHHPIFPDITKTIKVAEDLDVQEIFSTISPEQNHYIYQLMKDAEMKCIRFKVVPDLSVFFTKPVLIDYIRDLPVLSFRSEPLEDIGNRVKKRILDIVVSALVVIFILSWLFPLLGLLIYLESPGPILFKQIRTGKNNKPFYCYKFRSMRINKDADSKQATKNDSRVTRIGRFIRKTSLDEFPQFLNVLKGEMSLVGPRPHMVKHTNDFSKMVDHYMIRQFLKPGITGWAQVNGYRGEIFNDEQIIMRVRNDLWYLENWTIWLDIRILFLTVYNVMKGEKNAY
jgi:putative colanic acid biosynthesis UDP-glucose lipid carrier transferase